MNIQSTSFASPLDRTGWSYLGCEKQLLLQEPHRPYNDLCKAWFHLQPQASLEEKQWLTANRICHYGWHSSTHHLGCSTGKALCWSAASKIQRDLLKENIGGSILRIQYWGFYFCKLWQTVKNRLLTCILCIKSYSIIAYSMDPAKWLASW